MILAFYRRLYYFKCPTCQAIQHVLALGMTFKGGFAQGPVNAHTHCLGCKQRLRLAHRFGFIKTIAFQIGIAALCLVVFLVTVAAAMGLIQLLFGAWGLLVSPILLVMLPLIIAIIIGHLASLYREVLVV